MNAAFQHTNVDQCQLFADLNIFYLSLRSRVCRDEFLKKYEIVEESHVRSVNYINFGAKFLHELHESHISQELKTQIKGRCLTFLVTAINQVTKRLPEKFALYSTLKSFHPDVLLSQSKYVRFHNLNLEAFDSSHVDLQEVENQYINIRLLDWTLSDVDLTDMNKFWCHAYCFKNSVGVHCFRALASFVMKALCLPISNAYVERVFSQATIVKSRLRNKTSCSLLNSILMIRSCTMMNNSCCRDFHVTDDMLQKFNASMYDRPHNANESDEGEDDNENEEFAALCENL